MREQKKKAMIRDKGTKAKNFSAKQPQALDICVLSFKPCLPLFCDNTYQLKTPRREKKGRGKSAEGSEILALAPSGAN